MREIKFRGFNRKNNVWLYGFYLQNRGAHFICPDEFATGKSWDDYEIDPDTRGEFTGLKDKNGNEIYEGDIICFVNGQKKVNGEWVDNKFIYTIEYSEGAFRGVSCLSKALGAVEVIGNIHENPNLLT